jgi:hypothetical protein
VTTQQITNPTGITVFGSAIIRVAPDIVSLNFSVSQLEQHPKDAFKAVRADAQKVNNFLADSQITDFGASRISLEEAYQYRNNEHQFIGYRARVSFHVLLTELDRLEAILSGLVDAGVNRIDQIDYQTTRLKELRAQARQRAVAAAREKAEIYAQAAGVSVGGVLHIEDVNPDILRGHEGHTQREIPQDEGAPLQAFDPGSIVVNGAVMIAYALQSD